MGNSLRCFLACVLPCGALDVIRIVHLNGHVKEYSRPVSAGEILAANPHHIISKPCSHGVTRKILIVSPESELKRGHIYFLIPESAIPGKEEKKKVHKKRHQKTVPASSEAAVKEAVDHENFLKDVMSERKACHRRWRSGRVGVWRPHLESISED